LYKGAAVIAFFDEQAERIIANVKLKKRVVLLLLMLFF
jgi:hypothetical protein